MKKTLTLLALAPIAGLGFTLADTTETATISPAILEQIKAGTPMKLEYQIKASTWVFIIPISGKANFSAELGRDTYSIKGAVKTTGLADVLIDYDLQLAASGYVTSSGLDTYAYVSQNTDGKKNRRVELKYLGDDFTMEATPRFGNLGDPAATREQVLDAKDPVSALISLALEPRAEGEDPCGGPVKVFDGRQLTHLHLTNHGLKDVTSDAWQGEAYECHIRMDKVAGYKKGESNRDTLTGIDGPLRIWLAPLPNGATIPVRIEAETDDIGTVTLQASKLKFTPIEVVTE